MTSGLTEQVSTKHGGVCQLARIMSEGKLEPRIEFLVDEVLLLQGEVAFDEFGDTILERCPPEIVPEGISMKKASEVLSGVADCVRNMYLGYCAVNGCEGREEMKNKLNNLGIAY